MKKLIAIVATMLSFGVTSFGNTLQGVQLKDINNKPVSLNKYKGKKIYIKMWASWCPICLSGLSEINSLSADKSKNFTVITIASPGQKGEKPTAKFIQWYKGLNYKKYFKFDIIQKGSNFYEKINCSNCNFIEFWSDFIRKYIAGSSVKGH